MNDYLARHREHPRTGKGAGVANKTLRGRVVSVAALLVALSLFVPEGMRLARAHVATPREAHSVVATGGAGSLLVLDQPGGLMGPMVSRGTPNADILEIEGGTVRRVLARGVTVLNLNPGLAPSPRGRYVTFGQDAQPSPGRPNTVSGVWTIDSSGKSSRLVALSTDIHGEHVAVTGLDWSPDRYTLAYGVNAESDTPLSSRQHSEVGVWLTPYNRARPDQVATGTTLAAAVQTPGGGCLSSVVPSVTGLSWTPDGRTLAVGIVCQRAQHVASTSSSPVLDAVLALDTVTGRTRTLVADGQDPAVAPTGAIAYVTGGQGYPPRTALWAADAQGQHARRLATADAVISSPAWSPDGWTVTYLADSERGGHHVTLIRTIDSATRKGTTVLASNASGQPLLPTQGQFLRLAWMSPDQESTAMLTLHCATVGGRSSASCQLVGHGFRPREHVRVSYTVAVYHGQGRASRSQYGRDVTTGARGNFTRPPLLFALDPRDGTYEVTAVAIGAHGNRAATASGA